MARMLTAQQRIKLFKEINRVHKEIFSWKVIYHPVYGKIPYIDVERNVCGFDRWAPMSRSEAIEYYFRDRRGRDITSLRGLYAWQAKYFYHVNPYAYRDYDNKLKEGDFVSDDLGKRIGPNVSQPVECLETPISVQQRKEYGKIWISSRWLHHEDCYAAALPFADAITGAMDIAAGGDEMLYDSLWEKYMEICHANESEFEKALNTS